MCLFYVAIIRFFGLSKRVTAFFLNRWFARNLVALLNVTQRFAMNLSGTFRNDAKDLPDDRKEMKEEVKNESEGTHTTRYSRSHSATYFINKGRKVFSYISNRHSTTDQDTLRRR